MKKGVANVRNVDHLNAVNMINRFLKISMTFALSILFLLTFIPLAIVDVIRYIIWDIDEKEHCWNFFMTMVIRLYDN